MKNVTVAKTLNKTQFPLNGHLLTTYYSQQTQYKISYCHKK